MKHEAWCAVQIDGDVHVTGQLLARANRTIFDFNRVGKMPGQALDVGRQSESSVRRTASETESVGKR